MLSVSVSQCVASDAADSWLELFSQRGFLRNQDQVAVVCGDHSLTYGQIDRRSNQLAHFLQSQRIQRGDVVGLCVEGRTEMITAILGIHKAGAAYVPLDPNYPVGRLDAMLSDAKIRLVLVQPQTCDVLRQSSTDIICLTSDWANIAEEPDTDCGLRIGPDDQAYVIYTSGSTGRPRGVQVSHQNLWASTSARLQYYDEPVSSFLLFFRYLVR